MRKQYFLPKIVCLKANRYGEIIQGADIFISQAMDKGVWAKYIKQDSPWANPFPCFTQKQKEACLVQYEQYIRNEIRNNPGIWFPRMYEIISQGRPLLLGRFCGKEDNPLPNHGDIIIKILSEFIQMLEAGQIPDEYLQSAEINFPQNFNQTSQKIDQEKFIQEKEKIQETEMQVELPYVVMSIRGLQPSDKSKIVIIQVRDAEVGNFDIDLFISSGQVPTKVVHTAFGPTTGEQYGQQKATIQRQNEEQVLRANIIPAKLSDGTNPQGVCAQLGKAFDLKDSINLPLPPCDPTQNKALISAQQVSVPPGLTGATFGTLQTNRPTQPAQPAQPFLPIGQIASGGGLPSGNVSGTVIFPSAAQVAPGAVPIQVVDFTTGNILPNPMYQLPGGPRPIAFGEKWYWYLLPDGTIIKSDQSSLPAGFQRKARDTPTGANQKPKAERARAISLAKYGPVTGVIDGQKKPSSGRKPGALQNPIQPPTGQFFVNPAPTAQGSLFGGTILTQQTNPQLGQPPVNPILTNQPLVNQPLVNQPLTNQPLVNQPLINPQGGFQFPVTQKSVAQKSQEDSDFSSEEENQNESEDEYSSEEGGEFPSEEVLGAQPIQTNNQLQALNSQATVRSVINPLAVQNPLMQNQPFMQNPLQGQPLAQGQTQNIGSVNPLIGGQGFPGLAPIDLSKPYVPPSLGK